MTLGAGAWRTSVSYAVTTSWLAASGVGWTPATGNALVRINWIDNGINNTPVSMTIGGVSVTFATSADANHGGTVRGCGVALGTVRALPTGSPLDLALTSSGTTGIGRITVRLTDLVGWGGTVGQSNSVAIVNGVATTHAQVSRTVAGSGSLLAGTACTSDANTNPLSAANWTLEAEQTVGTPAGTSLDGAVFTRTGPDAGTSVTFSVTSTSAWTDFALGFIELL